MVKPGDTAGNTEEEKENEEEEEEEAGGGGEVYIQCAVTPSQEAHIQSAISPH